jgi:hypothetical protein
MDALEKGAGAVVMGRFLDPDVFSIALGYFPQPIQPKSTKIEKLL